MVHYFKSHFVSESPAIRSDFLAFCVRETQGLSSRAIEALAREMPRSRLLREHYAFRGTLRATGDVLRDQFHFLVRAGFDSFEVKKPADAGVFAEVLKRFSVVYQPGADGRVSALRRRLQADAKVPKRETA